MPVTEKGSNMNSEEYLKSKCPGCGSLPPLWKEVDDSIAGPDGVGPRFHCSVCDEYRVIVPFEPNDHEPVRGSEVELWVKHWRDNYTATDGGGNPPEWFALGALLDSYRDMADAGMSVKEARELSGGFDSDG